MRFAAVGQKYLWFFNAPDKTESRRIANALLFFEKLGADINLTGFSSEKGLWQAVPVKLTKEVAELIEKVDKSKIVEIKRRRPPVIDAIYLTRLQKERWSPEEAET